MKYEPAKNVICFDGSTDGRWFWQLDNFQNLDYIIKPFLKREPFRLPAEIFNKLKGGTLEELFPLLKYTVKNRIYDSYEEAMKALEEINS